LISEFLTNNGKKIPAVTLEQMVEIDRIAMEINGPNLFQMMENAGRNLAEIIGFGSILLLGLILKSGLISTVLRLKDTLTMTFQ